MTNVLAIDPGPRRSAYVLVEGESRAADGIQSDAYVVTKHGIVANDQLAEALRVHWLSRLPAEPDSDIRLNVDVVVIEQIQSFGMAVGHEMFETAYWSGRFAEAAYPVPSARIPRQAVKLHLCGLVRAKDPNVRAALIDRFGDTKADAIGTKKAPGPLYGIAADEWSALAVAVTWIDKAADPKFAGAVLAHVTAE